MSAASRAPWGGMPTASALAIRELSKTFPDGTVALDQVTLDVAPGEFMVVLGPTGCGKTTLLRMIAGLERPSAGHVLIDGEQVDHQPAQERRVAMVFQESTLYPHLSVAENIAFPLRVAGATDVEARVLRVAKLLGLTTILDRRPDQLSGGERQRVATGRALVQEPKIFLLDEPLSNLEAGLRAALRVEVAILARRLRVTTVYVTHDQSEAMTLADRVAVLRRGQLQQVGTPSEVYGDPATVFVAAFLGLPRPNLFQAAIYVERHVVAIDLGGQLLQMDVTDPRARRVAEHHAERVTVALRPEALTRVPLDTTGPVLRGRAKAVEYHGHEVLVYLDAGVIGTATQLSQLELSGADEDLVVAVPSVDRPRVGDELAFAVDLDRLLVFDHHGRRIRLE